MYLYFPWKEWRRRFIRYSGYPLVALVFLLIFGALGIYFFLISPSINYPSSLNYLYNASLLFLVFNIFYNYIKTVITNPGNPPHHNVNSGAVACEKCHRSKVHRAHHCSVCNKCILKFDHHCPWVNNCIGQNNYRFFFLFLVWLSIGCIFFFLTNLTVFYVNYVETSEPTFFNKLLHCVSHVELADLIIHNSLIRQVLKCLMIISFSSGISMAGFAGFHYYLAKNNLTTIEYHLEFSKYKAEDTHSIQSSWEHTFGSHRFLWIFSWIPARKVTVSLHPYHAYDGSYHDPMRLSTII